MSLFERTLGSITQADLEALRDKEVPEGRMLEFKARCRRSGPEPTTCALSERQIGHLAERQIGHLEVIEEDTSGGEGTRKPVRNVIPLVLRP